MNIKKIYFFIVIGLLFSINVLAQKSLAYTEIEEKVKKGIKLFNKKEYASAQKIFNDIIDNYPEKNSDLKTDAEYFKAVCAIELYNKDAGYLIERFVKTHPESPRLNLAQFNMAKLQFREQHYKRAIKWFKKVDPYKLNNDELEEYYFKYGYALFVNGDIEEAETMFGEIKDADTRFSMPAKYYFAHIQYEKGNYETALEEFLKLENVDEFKRIAPYYIIQTYYKLGNYSKVASYGEKLLEKEYVVKKQEIIRLIADSYFRLKNYKKAAEYFKKYLTYNDSPSRNDLFELAYSLFKIKNYAEALTYFEKIPSQNDSLYQNTNYLLAKCYLELNEKNKALNAFLLASKYDFYPDIKEESLFNYAKLTYELNFSPFDEVIKSFSKFIENYPNSKNIDEAYDFLARALYTTKNYQGALEALENIKVIREDIKEVYQRVAFFRALEYFKDGDYINAIIMFNNSINNAPKTDKYLKAKALFWRGEAYYRLKNYDEAIKSFKKFLLTPGAYEQKEYKLAHYNLGYAYFKQKNYKEAQKWFRKFISFYNNNDEPTELIADSYLRIGDCFFTQRKFDYALDYYKKVIETEKGNIPYALYQAGICYGLLGKYNEKVITLAKLINDYENVPYIDDALFEQGNAYMQMQEYQMAEMDFKRIISDFPKSKYVPDAYMALGLIYFNKEDYVQSKKYYQAVIDKFKGTKYFNEALQVLKTIYVEEGNVQNYTQLLQQKGLENYINETEEDSLTYLAAEKFYMKNNCSKAIEMFKEYLEKFYNGKYVANANFYIAECLLSLNKTESALEYYKNVSELATSKFTELALLRASKIAYKLEMWEEAYYLYKQLYETAGNTESVKKALLGMAKTAYKLGEYDKAQKYAKRLLSDFDQLLPEQKMFLHYIIAMSYYNEGKLDMAMEEFQMLSNKPENKFGAEAYYMIAKIYYDQQNYNEVENTVFNFVKTNTPHQYWLAKAFIILADSYYKQNNIAQAKATYQSLLDNYKIENDGIKEEVRLKYNKIIESEKLIQQQEQEEDFNIDYYDKIYEEVEGPDNNYE